MRSGRKTVVEPLPKESLQSDPKKQSPAQMAAGSSSRESARPARSGEARAVRQWQCRAFFDSRISLARVFRLENISRARVSTRESARERGTNSLYYEPRRSNHHGRYVENAGVIFFNEKNAPAPRCHRSNPRSLNRDRYESIIGADVATTPGYAGSRDPGTRCYPTRRGPTGHAATTRPRRVQS